MGYCYGCMEPIGQGESRCPRCGFVQDTYWAESHQLKPDTCLRDRYIVGKTMGEGGFGITYVGRDLYFDEKVAIKEFYMSGYVMRNHKMSDEIQSSGTYGEVFSKNRERFLLEARILAKFREETGIVNVRDFFKENNTAYLVMDFLDGINLREYAEKHGKISGDQVVELLEPIFCALESVHKQNLIHRDISPDNIMLTKDGKVKLLDFGAAREVSPDDTRSLTVILKRGYAPEEQYRSKGQQGPWTDVYALCATMYRCVTGIVPDDAMERMHKDKVQPPAELDCDCPQAISDAIMKGMSVYQENRYQSMQELRAGLEVAKRGVSKAPEEASPVKPAGGTIYAEELPDAPSKAAPKPVGTIQANETPAPAEPPKPSDASAQYVLGRRYERGEGVQKDMNQAFLCYQKAAELGHASAQNRLGWCYINGLGTKKDAEKALGWFKLSAEQGNGAAQNNLAWCYWNGHGTPKAPGLALTWYRKAADQGVAAAQYSLGQRCQNGQGVKKDFAEAFSWYQKAAAQGHASAQYSLGWCYHHGKGVEEDLTQAIAWYLKSAEGGNVTAQSTLGYCYKHGYGVEKDFARALFWYQKAAERGDVSALSNLGWFYQYGNGGPRDLVKAMDCYLQAMRKGDADSAEQYKQILNYAEKDEFELLEKHGHTLKNLPK